LLYVAANPEARVREIAEATRLTDRQVASLLGQLKGAGFLRVDKAGRRNRYAVNKDSSFLHPFIHDVPIGAVLPALASSIGEKAQSLQ
jgi:DNA-binding IclR family transcriptional regulator